MSDDYTTANVPGRLIMEKDAEITRLRADLAAANTRMSKLDFERTAAELERDALAARLAPVEDEPRHLTTDEQKVFHSALRRSAKIKKPVEDEELVEIVAKVLQGGDELEWSVLPEEWKKDWLRDARVAIAAIRPHIEAAEREKWQKMLARMGAGTTKTGAVNE